MRKELVEKTHMSHIGQHYFSSHYQGTESHICKIWSSRHSSHRKWSAEFSVFSRAWMFETSSPPYPQSNGKAENAVQTVKNLFTKCKAAGASEFQALLDWCNTPTAGIGTSPAQRLMRPHCKTLLAIAGSQLQPNFPTEEDMRKLIGTN